MADYNLGTARGVIEIGYDGKGVKDAKSDIEGVGTSSANSQKHLDSAAKAMAIGGGVIAAGLGLAVKSAADFQQSLANISAVTGATGASMDAVKAKALDLGAKTQFSAGEAASAIEELAKAGIPLQDVLNGAADATVALAAAGGIDLPQAATIASNAMNQFQLKAKDMPGVADAIAGAANASAIDVSEFGQSLQQVGAVANLAGVSFQDTSVAIALMGNAGIKASDAGTSLKTFFNNLNPTTDKARGLMQDLGLITADGANKFYDATGKLKPFNEVAQTLQNSLKGMTEQQKQATLQTLFGSDAIRAAAVISQNGAAGFDKMAESMSKVKAADVAKTKMDTFANTVENLKGSLETMAITLGSILIPFLNKLALVLTSVVNWFQGLPGPVQQAIIIFASVAASLLLAGAAFIKIVKFVQEMKMAFMALKSLTALRTLMSTIFGPWGLAILAVIALAYLIYRNWDTIKALLIQVWDAVKGAFIATWNAIKAAATAVWDWMRGAVEAVFGVISTIIMTYFNIYKAIITTAWDVIKAIFTTAFSIITGVASAFWGAFGGLFTAAFNLIVAIVKLGLALIALPFVLTFNAIKLVVTTVFDFLKPYIVAAFNFYKNIITTVLTAIVNFLRPIFDTIRTIFTTAFNAAKDVVSSVMNLIKSVVSTAISGVKSAISGLASIGATIGGYFLSAYNAVKDKVAALVSFVGGIGSRVVSAIGDMGKLLYQKGKDIIQGLIDGITSMIDKVTGVVNKVTGVVGKFLPGSPVKEGPLRVLNNGYAGGQIIKMITDGMERQLPTVEARMAMLGNTIVPTGNLSASLALPAIPQQGGGSVVWDVGGVSIPAKDLEEMRTVQDFFDRIQQESRKRTAGAGAGR